MARPSYKPTAAQRRQVSIAAGGGMTHEAIAMALGISKPTLEKHFRLELSSGAYARRFEALQGIHAAARKGNVSAAKAYLTGMPEFMPLEAQPASAAPQAPAPAAPPMGKKDAANAAAVTAQHGTGWDGLLPSQTPLQ